MNYIKIFDNKRILVNGVMYIKEEYAEQLLNSYTTFKNRYETAPNEYIKNDSLQGMTIAKNRVLELMNL